MAVSRLSRRTRPHTLGGNSYFFVKLAPVLFIYLLGLEKKSIDYDDNSEDREGGISTTQTKIVHFYLSFHTSECALI